MKEYEWYQATSIFQILGTEACRQTQSSVGTTSAGASGEDGKAFGTQTCTQAAAVNEAVGKKGFKRPPGNKKTGTFSEQTKEISKGSEGIASLAAAAHKRAKLGESALAVEKKKEVPPP